MNKLLYNRWWIDKEEKNFLLFASFSHAISDAWHMLFPMLIFIIDNDYNDYLFLSLLITITIITRAISGFLCGIISDKINSRYIFILFPLFSSLGCLIVFISTNQIVLGVGLSLLGLGTGIYHPISLSLISKNMKKHSEALGFHEAGGILGQSFLIISLISVAVQFGWKESFLLASFISILPLILMIKINNKFFMSKSNLHGNYTDSKLQLSSKFPIYMISIILVYSIIILLEGSTTATDSFLSAIIADLGGIGETTIFQIPKTALMYSLIVLFGTPGSILSGILSAKIGPEKALLIVSILCIPVLIFLYYQQSLILLITLPILRALISSRSPIQNVLIAKYIPSNKTGLGFGFMYGISPIIGAFIAIIGGYSIETYALKAVFFLASLIIILSLPLQIFLQSKKNIQSS